MVLVFQKGDNSLFQEVGLDFYLQLKYKKIYCAMYLRRHKFSLKVGFDG